MQTTLRLLIFGFVVLLLPACGGGEPEPHPSPSPSPSPAPSPTVDFVTATPSPLDISRFVEGELRKLTIGNILFNPAERMKVDDKERIEVRIARSLTEELTSGLKGRGEPRVEEMQVGPFMSARLTGRAFDIIPLSEGDQLVLFDGFTQWEWDVVPLKSGRQTLLLSIDIRVKIPGQDEETMSLPVFERQIDVRISSVSSVKNFLGKNWQWIITTVISAGLIGAIGSIVRKRRK